MVIQSGERGDASFVAMLEEVLRRVKDETRSAEQPGYLGVTLCIGQQRGKPTSGCSTRRAHRYLLRIETTNPRLFAALHPPEQQVRFAPLHCLATLRDIGYQVGTGVMIGRPNQTLDDLARDIQFRGPRYRHDRHGPVHPARQNALGRRPLPRRAGARASRPADDRGDAPEAARRHRGDDRPAGARPRRLGRKGCNSAPTSSCRRSRRRTCVRITSFTRASPAWMKTLRPAALALNSASIPSTASSATTSGPTPPMRASANPRNQRRKNDILRQTRTGRAGSVAIDAATLWGIHTQRALLELSLFAQARALRADCGAGHGQTRRRHDERRDSGHLPPEIAAAAMIAACDRIRDDEEGMARHFPLDALQGGAGTSTNMNLNEVIANLALEHLGKPYGDYATVHPLHHVNLHGSTNDLYPTALRIAAIAGVRRISAAMAKLQGAFQAKETAFSPILKNRPHGASARRADDAGAGILRLRRGGRPATAGAPLNARNVCASSISAARRSAPASPRPATTSSVSSKCYAA